MTDEAQVALEFLKSVRGQYIVSQALTLGIAKLEEVEGAMREVSNIADMVYLRDNLFPIFKAIKEATHE